MRRVWYWVTGATLAALMLTVWGAWSYRLATANRDLSVALEAERQRNFTDMAYHVEQIQSLLGKGLVAGTARQNMRFMGDAQYHALAATTNFTSLPLPAELSATVGKFLKQTGDFAGSVLRNEAAGGALDDRGRAELGRLRQQSSDLSGQLQTISAQYNQGGFRWNPPLRFSWASLVRGGGTPAGKPATGAQAPASMVSAGWDQVGTSMQRLPVMIYDGPFSDHVAQRTPATQGAPVSRPEAERRMLRAVPNAQTYRIVEVTDVGGNLPGYSFRLAPTAGAGAAGAAPVAGAAAGAGAPAYTTTAEISSHGGYLMQLINSRMVGKAAIDLNRARELGLEYLAAQGYTGMAPTYGQVDDNTATIAYAYRQDGVLVYPDQIKLKIALDNGEVLAVDARQYLLSHRPRTIAPATVTVDKAEELIRPELTIERTQPALIPNEAGTGELLAWEFLTRLGNETFLVYVNARTGQEEQILQQVQTDNGTFAL